MKTKKQYLNREVTHREYHAQFVTNRMKSVVKQKFGVQKLKDCINKDKYLNNIPLSEWEKLGCLLTKNSETRKRIKRTGSFWALADGVCIVKEAAKQLIEEE